MICFYFVEALSDTWPAVLQRERGEEDQFGRHRKGQFKD